MYFVQFINKKRLAVVALAAFICNGAVAQSTAASTAPAESGSNLLAILLVSTAIVLAFVIWGMGQALITISRQVMEKSKAAGKVATIIMFIGFSLLSQGSFAQDAATTSAVAAPNYGGLSANTFYAFLGVLLMEISAIFFLAFAIRRIYQELLPEKQKTLAKTTPLAAWWASLNNRFFTRAVPVEREADILLDHDYDGIQELDNSLPPWWKYGFVVTIICAFIYLGYFHAFGSGKNPTEEYAAEMEQARIEKETFEANNKDKIDEKNVPMADADGLKAGQVMFEANCSACHLKDGGGNVGPNLADNYWLHKGSLNDIYATIKNGYPDKGMQSWSSKFNPKEISLLASYVKSLKGSKPATPKAPQGDLFEEDGAATAAVPAAIFDSTKAKTDTAIKVKTGK